MIISNQYIPSEFWICIFLKVVVHSGQFWPYQKVGQGVLAEKWQKQFLFCFCSLLFLIVLMSQTLHYVLVRPLSNGFFQFYWWMMIWKFFKKHHTFPIGIKQHPCMPCSLRFDCILENLVPYSLITPWSCLYSPGTHTLSSIGSQESEQHW